MKTTLLIICSIALLLASYSISQDQVKINIKKNDKGEMIFGVSGHTTPVALEVNGKTVNVEVGQSEVNLEKEFAFSAFSSKTSEADIDTAAGNNAAAGSGAGAISGSQQFNPLMNPLLNPNLIPPVTSSSNPSQATPTGSDLTSGDGPN